MLIRRLGTKLLLNTKIVMNSGGGKAPYDWRDDPSQNTDYQLDSRTIGVKKATQYTFPHTQEPRKWQFNFPENYDAKNLHQNISDVKNVGQIQNLIEVGRTDFISDVPHEFDYESQDLDFQAQTFESQHFRKKGSIMIWVIIGTTPLWWFAHEIYYQEWPDANNYRYQRAPPLNWPNQEQNPDSQLYSLFHSKPYNQLWDAGILADPWFEIKEGKKVYSKWSGVNQPMAVI